jgi:hypothetical protein
MFCQISPGFHFFGFRNNVLQGKVVDLASNPQSGGLDPCIYVPQWRRAQLYPQGSGSLFVAFYDSQGYDAGILTRFHMGYDGQLRIKIKFPRF